MPEPIVRTSQESSRADASGYTARIFCVAMVVGELFSRPVCNHSGIGAKKGNEELQVDEQQLHALMVASLAGDASAYRVLLGALTPRLRSYFRRRLEAGLTDHAEDLVQETLLAIHSRRMTFDPAQPVTAWVYAIARYKLIDLLRRSRKAMHIPIDDIAEFVGDASVATDDAMTKRDVDAMLDTLPDRAAMAIRSVRLEGKSVAETAAATGLSVASVKVVVHRGIKALKKRFGDET